MCRCSRSHQASHTACPLWITLQCNCFSSSSCSPFISTRAAKGNFCDESPCLQSSLDDFPEVSCFTLLCWAIPFCAFLEAVQAVFVLCASRRATAPCTWRSWLSLFASGRTKAPSAWRSQRSLCASERTTAPGTWHPLLSFLFTLRDARRRRVRGIPCCLRTLRDAPQRQVRGGPGCLRTLRDARRRQALEEIVLAPLVTAVQVKRWSRFRVENPWSSS